MINNYFVGKIIQAGDYFWVKFDRVNFRFE